MVGVPTMFAPARFARALYLRESEKQMKSSKGRGIRMILAAAVGAGVCSMASAQNVVWDEAVDGDLSDDWLNPTQLPTLLPGLNTVTFSVVNSDDEVNGDRDYFTITIPAGYQMSTLDLLALSADGPDDIAFLAIQVGNQVTVNPNFPNPEPLLGWMLTQQQNVGNDILEIMIGQDNIPLGPGQYSFWAQQTGQDLTTMTLGFNIELIPSPGTLGVAGLAMFGAMRRRR